MRWVAAIAAMLALGCGRTQRSCSDCAEVGSGGSGGSGTSGAGGSAGGAGGAGSSGGGSGGTGGSLPPEVCQASAPTSRLQRHHIFNLQWTLDAALGQGQGFTDPLGEEPDYERAPWPQFVEVLVDWARARAAAVVIDPAELAPCCVEQWLHRYGDRLYRRVLSPEQIAAYVAQLSALRKSVTVEQAARTVLVSMVLSPYYVFRVEHGTASATALAAPAFPQPTRLGYQLDAFDVAVRLSQLAISQGPDPELLQAAASGKLSQPEQLLAQLERLLATPEAERAWIAHFRYAWRLPRPLSGPIEDQFFAAELEEQTDLFLLAALEQPNPTLAQLLTATRLPLNRRIAEHYGLSPSAIGADFEWVELDSLLFSGVLSQPALLARYPTPTQRGLFVMHRLMCQNLPPHPASLDPGQPTGTTPRERILSVTTGNPPCPACHRVLDPAGFALEAFDHAGRLTGYDTTGALNDPQSSSEPQQLAGPADLGRAVAEHPAAARCAIQQFYERLVDRRVEDEWDALTIECIASRRGGQALDLKSVLHELTVSSAMSRMHHEPLALAPVASEATDPIDHALEEIAALAPAFTAEEDLELLRIYSDQLRERQRAEPRP